MGVNIFEQFTEFMNRKISANDLWTERGVTDEVRQNLDKPNVTAVGDKLMHGSGKSYPTSSKKIDAIRAKKGFKNEGDECCDKEEAFARELSDLLDKYGIEVDDDFENEDEEEEAKEEVAEDFEKKEDADTKEEKAEDDKKIEEDELKENEEYGNSKDFDYFKKQYNKIAKAAPAATFETIEEQRKLGKEIF